MHSNRQPAGQRVSRSGNVVVLKACDSAANFWPGMPVVADDKITGEQPRTGWTTVLEVSRENGTVTLEDPAQIVGFCDGDFLFHRDPDPTTMRFTDSDGFKQARRLVADQRGGEEYRNGPNSAKRDLVDHLDAALNAIERIEARGDGKIALPTGQSASFASVRSVYEPPIEEAIREHVARGSKAGVVKVSERDFYGACVRLGATVTKVEGGRMWFDLDCGDRLIRVVADDVEEGATRFMENAPWPERKPAPVSAKPPGLHCWKVGDRAMWRGSTLRPPWKEPEERIPRALQEDRMVVVRSVHDHYPNLVEAMRDGMKFDPSVESHSLLEPLLDKPGPVDAPSGLKSSLAIEMEREAQDHTAALDAGLAYIPKTDDPPLTATMPVGPPVGWPALLEKSMATADADGRADLARGLVTQARKQAWIGNVDDAIRLVDAYVRLRSAP